MTIPYSEDNAVDLFMRVGRALVGNDEWRGDVARMMGVSRETVRQWLNGRMELRRAHFESLLALVTRRKAELDAAERELGTWLARHPKEED